MNKLTAWVNKGNHGEPDQRIDICSEDDMQTIQVHGPNDEDPIYLFELSPALMVSIGEELIRMSGVEGEYHG